jgi:hypothetical protein
MLIRTRAKPSGTGLFSVGYAEWLSPTRNPQRRVSASRSCEGWEVDEVIDRYALRLVLVRQYQR